MGTTNIVLGAQNIRELETTASGTTRIYFNYTKNDERVTTLTVRLKTTTGTTLDSIDLDVSLINVGETRSFDISLSNSLVNTEVTPDNIVTATVPAGTEQAYTPPAGYDAIVLGEDAGITIVGLPLEWSNNVVVLNGETITMQNTGTTDKTVTIYELIEGTIPKVTLVLEFEEKDSGGTILHSNSINIEDVSPLTINTGGGGGSV